MAKKIQLSYKEIEKRLRILHDQPVEANEIGYVLLYAFGKGEREIARMREGKSVIKTFDGLLVKGEFCYCVTTTLRLTARLEELKTDSVVVKSTPKIIAVSDGQTIRAYDTRQKQTFEQQVDRLFCDFEFFYPLAGVERVEYVEESPADIKAAEKLAKLHDEIRAFNEFSSDSDLHDLNTFIARLLFCYFAEDTGIFDSNVFTNAIVKFTKDAQNLKDVLEQIFRFMGGKPIPVGILQTYCQQHFAYVGGGLFDRSIYIPELSNKARQIIIDSGELDWQSINPDIFGSMIQAVVNPDVRANQGMHYTSVPNIMKVIQPLFLDELTEEKNKLLAQLDEQKKLLACGGITQKQFYDKGTYIIRGCRNLLKRMSACKFFDPACGSGNFLIITYKQLRLLELDILGIIRDSQPGGLLDFGTLQGTVISLRQFYGIELLDFPHEIAMLSLWLAEHQMNRKLYQDFGVVTDALPLKDICQIKRANACRIDWNEVCPHTKDEEVYIFGNPPYLGSSMQDDSQKEDMDIVCGHFENYKNLDYIACWFNKGAQYIKGNISKYAFVSTNSITQGEQVSLLWPNIITNEIEIQFAYKSFKWTNNAKHKAAVIVVIIGLANSRSIKNRIIYENGKIKSCQNINPYLMDAPNVLIGRTSNSISGFPEMIKGSMPSDGGYLILSYEEKCNLVAKYPEVKEIIKGYTSADDFLNGKSRYCLWCNEDQYNKYKSIPELSERFKGVEKSRLESDTPSTQEFAKYPYMFRQPQFRYSESLIVPSTSSERRKYIPIGLLDNQTIASNAALVAYGATIVTLGIISSNIHMIWMRITCGRLKTDYRYSNTLCYNTFPFPRITETKKTEIEEAATDILLTREPYLTMGKTLADLYDPDTMPEDLLAAHKRLDDIVESCYPGYPFASDEARLECLFKMYEKMTKK